MAKYLKSLQEYKEDLDGLHFAARKISCLASNHEAVCRYLIVVKDQYGFILQWTDWAKYVDNKELLRPISRNNGFAVQAVVEMLNYLFCGPDAKISDFHEITHEVLEYYFSYLAQKKTKRGNYCLEETLLKKMYACLSFISNLSKDVSMKVKKKDLWVKQEIFLPNRSTHNQSKKVKLVPNFVVNTFTRDQDHIFRDVPEFALEQIFQSAVEYYPQLVMPMALGAFAGLRPGECCQVTQERVGGIQCFLMGSRTTRIVINLSIDKKLRKDGLDTGHIKKYRMQDVYPAFLDIFQKILEFQEKYLDQVGYDEDFCPLVIDARGNAMTVDAYRSGFQRLVKKHVIPALLNDPNPRAQQYGQMLMGKTLSPHAMRHWFSTKLVLMGETATTLQHFRGDKCIDSSYTYIVNKSDLVRKYELVSEQALTNLLVRGESLNG